MIGISSETSIPRVAVAFAPTNTTIDHPWSFETEILAGAYVEEVFHLLTGGGWRSELVYRNPGAMHQVPAEHVHRIVDLPRRECLDRGASRCKRAGNAVLAVQR